MAANFWTSTYCNHWILERAQVEASNKRDKEFISAQEVKWLKINFCQLISKLAQRLKLRQRVVATAIVYFRRFYCRNNFMEYDATLIYPTCVYLASKVEECTVQARIVAKEMKAFDPKFPYGMAHILECEFYVFEEMNFYMVVYHPYKPLPALFADCEANKEFMETTWRLVNDSYHTDLSLLYAPYIIALGSLYLAAFLTGVDLRAWFTDLNVDMKEIWEVSKEILDMYEQTVNMSNTDTLLAKLPVKFDYAKV